MSAADLYPFSTQDGKAIPIEIISPKAMARFAIVDAVSSTIAIPVGYLACFVYATQDCVLQFSNTLPNAPIAGTSYSDCVFIPANTPLTIKMVEGAAKLLGVGGAAGSLYLTKFLQWGGLAQAQQTSTG